MDIKNIDFLFSENPNPMWVYDPSDLSIKLANESACALYGYSEEELLSLTIKDLRPDSEHTKLMEHLSVPSKEFNNAGIWKHRKKNGDNIFVRVLSNPITHENKIYKLITVRDVTNEMQYQQEQYMLFETSLDGIMLTNPDGRIYRANKAACEILGLWEEEIVQLGREGIVHKDHKLQRALERRARTGNFSGELAFIHKSGRKIPVELTSSVYTNMQGEQRTSMLFRDITDRKKKEEQIKDVNEKLNAAQEIGKIGYWEFDIATEEIYWSEQSYRIWGYDPAEHDITTEMLLERVHFEDVDDYNKQIEKTISTLVPLDFVHRLLLPDGTVKWVHVLGNIKKDANGEIQSLEGTAQDITDRKHAELELVKSFKEKETILESIGDGFFTINKDWIVTYWNSAAERMLETPKDTIVGKNLWDVFKEAIDLPSYANYHRVMEEGIALNFEDYYPPLGRWYNISAYPSSKGITVYVHEITEQKRREAKLLESLAEKETLLLEIHHRVKNNLAVVSGMMQLQAYKEEDEKVIQNLSDSIGRIKTMASIHELLYQSENFSRLEADKNIKKLVTDIINTFQTAVELDIKFDIQQISLNINQAIPLSLIINEVITNVLKHAFDEQDHGALSLTLREEDNIINIQIVDNGKGLPQDFRKYKSKNSLGMQLIETLTNQLHAEYSYRTVEGETHFTLTFEKADVKGSGNSLLQ